MKPKLNPLRSLPLNCWEARARKEPDAATSPTHVGRSRITLLRAFVRTERVKVAFYQRKPTAGTFSVEGYFALIRELFPSRVEWKLVIPRYESRGVWRRIHNLLEARLNQGDVNHIAGDIHHVALFLEKRRTVLTILDCGFEASSTGLRRIILRWLWFRIPARRVAAITTISNYSRERIIKNTGCAPAKVRVVYACVSPAFKPIPRAFNGARPSILAVGTPPNKNLERLAAALNGLNCRLHVIGRLSAPQRAALVNVEYANSYGLSEDALVRAYSEADLVAFVSTYEGFGMPILEANAVGRPVVTSNVASMPEVAGTAACFVDPFSIESIRNGLVRVIDDADFRAALVQRGFANVLRFDPVEISRQYAAVYDSLMADVDSGCMDQAGGK